MMLIHRPSVDADELISERRIHSITNTESAIELRVDCYCGRRHTVRTGRKFVGPRTELDW